MVGYVGRWVVSYTRSSVGAWGCVDKWIGISVGRWVGGQVVRWWLDGQPVYIISNTRRKSVGSPNSKLFDCGMQTTTAEQVKPTYKGAPEEEKACGPSVAVAEPQCDSERQMKWSSRRV